MQADAQKGGATSQAPPDRVHFIIPATPLDVRAGLHALMTCAPVGGLTDDSLGTTELVLAEALNNVVEHAYAQHAGQIEVWVQRGTRELRVQISDTGLPMPGAMPPCGALPDMSTFDDLPEGGFGWFLIRSLAQDLSYEHDGGRNTLCFSIFVDNKNEQPGLVPIGQI